MEEKIERKTENSKKYEKLEERLKFRPSCGRIEICQSFIGSKYQKYIKSASVVWKNYLNWLTNKKITAN